MLASLPGQYADTLASLPTKVSQLQHAPPAEGRGAAAASSSPPSPPPHPLVRLLTAQHSAAAALPQSTSASVAAVSAALPPSASEYLQSTTAVHPYVLCCLTCSALLSDCFHVTDGDDSTVTVNALYRSAVHIPCELELSALHGAFFPVHCLHCRTALGRFFRFTAPQDVNRANMFELDCAALRVQILGRGDVRGEEYATETGMAARLTQVMLSMEALRDEQRQLRDLLHRALGGGGGGGAGGAPARPAQPQDAGDAAAGPGTPEPPPPPRGRLTPASGLRTSAPSPLQPQPDGATAAPPTRRRKRARTANGDGREESPAHAAREVDAKGAASTPGKPRAPRGGAGRAGGGGGAVQRRGNSEGRRR